MRTKNSTKLTETITAAELAELSNLSQRRIYQLVEEKRLPPAVKGRFPLQASVRQLFQFYQRDGETLQREKMLKTAAERKLREHELAMTEGQYLKKSDVERDAVGAGRVLNAGLDNWLELRLRVKALEKFHALPATPPLTPEQLTFVVETFCDLGRETNLALKADLSAALDKLE